jgi:hypothetical protein
MLPQVRCLVNNMIINWIIGYCHAMIKTTRQLVVIVILQAAACPIQSPRHGAYGLRGMWIGQGQA